MVKFKYTIENIKFNESSTYTSALQTIKDHLDQIAVNDFSWLKIISNNRAEIIKLLLLADVPVFSDIIFCKSFYDIDIIEFEVPSNIEIIEHHAFYLNYLEKITFQPDCHLTLIQRKAFEDCEISEIELPDEVMHLESYVFKDCGLLNKVVLNKNICSIGQGCFYGCPLKEIYYKGTKKDFEDIVDIDDLWLEGSNIEKIICTDGIIGV